MGSKRTSAHAWMARVTASTATTTQPNGSRDGRIEVHALTKVFGQTRAVDQLSFTVEPGSVTGFLGPNGAGKTTTLRMILGLVRPTSGRATISGVACHVMTAAAALPDARADEVLEMVGLGGDGKRKVRQYSLGMRQRLGLAATL